MRKKSINTWIVLCFAGIFVLSLGITAIANFQENYRAGMARADEDMKRCAISVNLELTGLNFNTVLDPENEGVYEIVRTDLLNCAKLFDIDHLFVYSLDPGTHNRKIFFYVSSNPEMGKVDLEKYPPGTESDAPTVNIEDRWLAGEKNVSGSLRNGQETFWFHAFRDGSNNFEYMVAMERNVMLENREILKSFLWDIIPIALILLTGLVSLLILVRRRIIQPIAVISKSMSRFASDGSRKPEPLRIKYQDEIGQIASVYNKMTADISAYVGSIERLNREKLEAKVQLDIAREIQYGLVPSTAWCRKRRPCMASVFAPAP